MEIFFKQNLIFLFESTGLTQSDVQENLEISKGLMSKYCNGKISEPSVKIAGKIAKIFKITLHDLIFKNLSNQYPTNYDEKVISFILKLINNTKNNKLCDWNTLDLDKADTEACIEPYKCKHLKGYWLDDSGRFLSKSMNDFHISDELTVFSTTNEIGEFIIVKFDDEIYKSKNRYEIHVMKTDGSVHEICSSHFKDEISDEIICNEKYYDLLNDLYSLAYEQQSLSVIYKHSYFLFVLY